jgi:hypothetical protein
MVRYLTGFISPHIISGYIGASLCGLPSAVAGTRAMIGNESAGRRVRITSIIGDAGELIEPLGDDASEASTFDALPNLFLFDPRNEPFVVTGKFKALARVRNAPRISVRISGRNVERNVTRELQSAVLVGAILSAGIVIPTVLFSIIGIKLYFPLNRCPKR